MSCVSFLKQADFQAAQDIPAGPKLESQSAFVFLCEGTQRYPLVLDHLEGVNTRAGSRSTAMSTLQDILTIVQWVYAFLVHQDKWPTLTCRYSPTFASFHWSFALALLEIPDSWFYPSI